MKQAIRWISLILLLTLVAGGMIACLPESSGQTKQTSNCDEYSPTFRQVCMDVGINIIGEKKSEVFLNEEKNECVYTTNLLMCYDLSLSLPQVRLQPLTKHVFLGPEAQYINENVTCDIDPRLKTLDDSIQARNLNVGKLVTCPDYSNGKIVQFRENIGYWVPLHDPKAKAEVIPLGRLACDQYGGCENVLNNSSPQTQAPKIFPCAQTFERINLGAEIGLPVFQAQNYDFKDSMGRITKHCDHLLVFAGMAFCMSADCLQFEALPLGADYGAKTLPIQTQAEMLDRTYFIETSPGEGFFVYRRMDQWMSPRGGYALFGLPISAPQTLPDGKIYQCFKNVCLLYDPFLTKEQGDITAYSTTLSSINSN